MTENTCLEEVALRRFALWVVSSGASLEPDDWIDLPGAASDVPPPPPDAPVILAHVKTCWSCRDELRVLLSVYGDSEEAEDAEPLRIIPLFPCADDLPVIPGTGNYAAADGTSGPVADQIIDYRRDPSRDHQIMLVRRASGEIVAHVIHSKRAVEVEGERTQLVIMADGEHLPVPENGIVRLAGEPRSLVLYVTRR